MVLNRSNRPLYLMPGELIYGGEQDRTIGEEAIIPPGEKPVVIEVFCVEQGRWGGRTEAETAEALNRLADASGRPLDAKARQKLAEEAKKGKFVAHAGSLNSSGRAAVQEGKGQAEVWDKVGSSNARSARRAQATPSRRTTPTPRCSNSFRPTSRPCNALWPNTSKWSGPSSRSTVRSKRWTYSNPPRCF